jgi:hypothetical protein
MRREESVTEYQSKQLGRVASPSLVKERVMRREELVTEYHPNHLGRVASPILVKESVMRREELVTEYHPNHLGRVASPILVEESVMRREVEPVTEYQTKPAGASSISHPGKRECHEKRGDPSQNIKPNQLGRVASPILGKESVMRSEETRHKISNQTSWGE